MLISSPIASMPAMAGWQMVKDGTAAQQQQFRQTNPMIERDIAYFRENIASAKTAKDLVADQRLFEFALRAHGLGEKTSHNAFMRQLLEEDPLDKESMVNRLSDPKYRELALKFNYPNMNGLNLSSASWQKDMVDKYVTWRHEEAVGQQNPNLRLAMYFQRKIADAENWFDVMGDKPLYEVVRSGLNLPDQIAGQDVDKQKRIFAQKIDFADLKKPETMDQIVQTFLARKSAEGGPQPGATSPAIGLLGGGGVRAGMVQISLDLSNQLMGLR
jgi:hypothetical protein